MKKFKVIKKTGISNCYDVKRKTEPLSLLKRRIK